MLILCKLDDCDLPVRSCGLCNRHYLRLRRHGDPLAGGRERVSHHKLGKLYPAEYKAWDGMVRRCHSDESDEFQNYGARGIFVCDRWRNSFKAFLEDMGERPSPEFSIDRRDNNGPYEPSNCRWATAFQQANNRRNTRSVDFRGTRRTIGQLARLAGIPRNTLYMRIVRYGWAVERAISEPLHEEKRVCR